MRVSITRMVQLLLLLALVLYPHPSGAQAGSVCISEIMYHPYHARFSAEQTEREWIELFNGGAEAVNLSGWQLTDGVYFAFPEVVLEPGAHVIVAADLDTFQARHADVRGVVGGWTDWLSNSGETIELRNASGAIVDRLEYSDEGDWAQRELGPVDHGHRGWIWRDDHDGGGKSLELVDPNVSNEYGQNWAASIEEGGTPGRTNSVQASGSAPLIQDVLHWPAVPRTNERVTITARIVTPEPSAPTVTLHYRIDEQAEFASLPMFDDGQHGDGSENDTVYGAELRSWPGGTIVEFYVEATDSTGQARTWPAPSLVDGALAQVTNALYVVDKAFEAEAQWQPGNSPLYYLVMLARDRAELEEIGDEDYSGNLFTAEPMSDAQMNATFISVDGSGTEIRYQAGVRNRGNRKRADPPMSYRVKFAGDRPWRDVGALNLNSKYPHLELMGSVLFQMAGLPAADVTVVRLKVNDDEPAQSDYGRTYGFYSAVEVLDGDWAKNHFPDDDNGNLYRCTYYEDGVHARTYADLDFKEASGRTPDPNDYRLNYPKKTNEAADDWSDLFALIAALNDRDVSDDEFLASVSAVIDLQKWTRFLALDAMIGNWEGGLTSGSGDDYALYRGAVDLRFWLVPHDLDTVLGQGDHAYRPERSIWGYADVDGLYRLLNHPDVIRMYYQQCRDVAQTMLAPEDFDRLVDRLLGAWVPDSEINGSQGIKRFVRERVQSVLDGGYPADDSRPQIPQEFAIFGPEVVGSYQYTVNDTITLTGVANAIDTRSVRVNGTLVDEADWSQRDGTWSIDAVALDPGINRVTVQAFDGPAGTGNEIERGTIDIWYDDGDMAPLSGVLTDDMRLTAADGPWLVPTMLTIPDGVTLTIQLGATLFFEEGAGIEVLAGGRLVVKGTASRRIRLTRVPNSSGSWQGLRFENTLEDNRFYYVDIEFADGQGESVAIRSSRVSFYDVTWAGTDRCILDVEHPTVTVRNSVFPAVSDAEPVHGVGLSGDEQLIFERCVFGSATGYNDIIDFAGGQRPGPILQIYDSVFLGGGDDGADMDGTDAHLEGNVFMHFNRNQGGDSTSNALATGSNGGDTAEICVVRNVFIGNDHDVLLKEDAFLHAENNTFVDTTVAALSFGEPDRSPPRTPGRGAYLARNIFWNNAALFAHFFEEPHADYGPGELAIDDSILPAIWHDLGLGNIDADPLFEGTGDLRPKAMSPARTMGPFDLEVGAFVPGGAWIVGEPPQRTCRTDAALTVCGPGITHYQYSLNEPNGPWSEERSIDEPIALTGLQDGGSYTAYVLGKNSAGRWQEEPTASRTWTVDVSYGHLAISEVLAANESAYEHEGTFPDLIELFYEGPGPLNLAGMRLSDDPDRPGRFVFPVGTTMRPGDYLVLYADDDTGTSGMHTGFGLDRDGEQVCLYDADGSLLDAVTFGYQLTDLSIGRVGYEGRWALTVPTPGAANIAVPMGDPDRVRINEWLACGEQLFTRDFIELCNPQGAPVDIGGFALTDNPITQRNEYTVRPLTFIAAEGLGVFWADEEDKPGHVSFRLSSNGEWIGLFGPGPREVDKVFYGPQVPDVSQGRAPDGSEQWDWFYLPTPGVANPALVEPVTTEIVLVPEDADKRVIVPTSADHVAASWNADPGFDDTAWLRLSGAPGGVGYERTSGYADLIGLDVENQMYGLNGTCYIRIPFSVSRDELGRLGALTLSVRYDDGFVAYLNGTEIARANIVAAPQWDSKADGNNEANGQDFDAVLDVSADIPVLREGMNVLAIHGLNVSTTSSDFLIAAQLDATLMDLTDTAHPYLNELQILDGLRITELMYHAPEGDGLDYIELTNIGDVTLDLTGLRFTEGIEFTFPALELAPGQRMVVVADVAAFSAKYGADVALAGAYSGRLNDGGEDLVLKLAEPFDAAVARFRYDDRWYPATDGGGLALVLDDEATTPEISRESERWRAAEPTPGMP